ncbi:MAG: hypothetical protein CMK07_16000 [Ponticaulis sp.]|nr:hypothetical protein [Ponticaulis sp.]
MKRALYFAMPLAVAIVIAWGAFSSVPPIPKLFEQQDKVEHLLAFGALSFWLLAALGPRRTVLAACLSVGAAVGLELVQHVLIPSRSGSLADLSASLMGIVGALVFVIGVRHVIRNRSAFAAG